MHASQFHVQEILEVFRRRRRLFIACLAVVFGACTIGAFVLPRKYESSTTILVQKDEVLNPLVSYTMAVAEASEDRLRSFNEIVFSKMTVRQLIDSLGLEQAYNVRTPEQEQELVKQVGEDISTSRPGSASFRISYLDTDPVRAQKAVALISRYFISTILKVENQRNELAVEFFEKKLEELRSKFDSTQGQMVATLRSHISEMPVESRTVSAELDDANKEMGAIDDRVGTYEHTLQLIGLFPDAMGTENAKEKLFEIQRKDVPYAGELRPLVERYDELTRRYTRQYPEVKKIESQILELLMIMKTTLENEINKERNERWALERRQSQLVGDLQQMSVTQVIDKDQASNLDLYRGLYDDMKIKLEQARSTRDLGKSGREQFLVIDPPVVPMSPTKPNRVLIISGGGVIGLMLGIIAVVTAELLDTRIHSARDLSMYKKHVIAYIPSELPH